MKTVVVRLRPGEDLRKRIEEISEEEKIGSGVIQSGVGSLTSLKVRLADNVVKEWNGSFEIVSLTGTLSQDGIHLHISAANEEGAVFGGHLKYGCIIMTTVELVIIIIDDHHFSREHDDITGYSELVVR